MSRKMMLEYLSGIKPQQPLNEALPILPLIAGPAAAVATAIASRAYLDHGIDAINPGAHTKKVPSEELPKRDADKSTWKGNAPGKSPVIAPRQADAAEVMQTTGTPSREEQTRRDVNAIVMDYKNKEQGLPSEQERLDTAAKIRKERGTSLPSVAKESYILTKRRIIENTILSLIEDDRFPVRDNPPQRTPDFPSDPIRSGSDSSTTRAPSPSQVGRAENDRIRQEKKDAAAAAQAQAVKDKIAAREKAKQDAIDERKAIQDQRDRARDLKGTWTPSSGTGQSGVPNSAPVTITSSIS